MARAERDDSASEPYSDELNITSPSVLDTTEIGNIEHFSNSASEANDDEFNQKSEDEISDDLDTNDTIKKDLSTVSFGILAKAQNSLRGVESVSTRKRKRDDERDRVAEEKLKALRDRLRELQNIKKDVGMKQKLKRPDIKTRSEHAYSSSRQQHKVESNDEDEISSSDNESISSSEAEVSRFEKQDSSTEENKSTLKKQRSSKHAPTELSSKRAVSRKRQVIPLQKSTARDPRFDPLSGPLRHDAIAKKYAFLNEYQKSELTELKSTLKLNKKLSDSDRETLKKKILSIESRQKAVDAKEKEREILRQHRKKEKEMVEKGKKPFYLKKSEVKKQALVKKFEGMKGKDIHKAIERRRRKLAAKERRNIPDTRRA